MLRYTHDRKADAVYIYFSDSPYAGGKDLDDLRRIDYDINKKPVGLEILCVSQGVNLENVPHASEVEIILARENIRVLA